MNIDMEEFGQEVDKLKRHVDSSRDLIGSEVADHIINRFGNAYNLDEYFNSTIKNRAVEILRTVCRDMSHGGVVGSNCQTDVEGWHELYTIYHDWLKLVHQANGPAGFSFTHSSYIRSRYTLQRQR